MNKKLEEFKKRNRRRNKHLYEKSMIEGEDYFICPISKERLKSIGNRYITETLDMSVKEYNELYPNIRRKSEYKQNKIDKFKKRNQRRNKHLYSNNMVEGKDFIICPESKERLSMIKTSYITNILGMTTEEYDKLYPNIRGVCKARNNNIKTGLKKIDRATGLTKHELSMVKAKLTLSNVDENGLTGYEKKGRKTRRTHLKNIDEFGRNGYQRLSDYRKETILSNGLTVEKNSHIKRINTCIKKYGTISPIFHKYYGSKQSEVLDEIAAIFKENKLRYFYRENEFFMFDKEKPGYYAYDLTCPKLNLVIEFQGSGWHPNPFILDDKEWELWKSPIGTKADEKHKYDYNKARAIYRIRKFNVFFVYHDSAENDINIVKEYIYDRI